MIPVPDEVVREVVRDLREYHGYLRHDNGVGAPRAQENAELLEDLLEDDRLDLDELASEVTHARTEDIRIYSTDIDRVEYLHDDSIGREPDDEPTVFSGDAELVVDDDIDSAEYFVRSAAGPKEEVNPGPGLDTPYEPAIDAKSMDDLDGINLDSGDGCPHCGGRRAELYMPNAGYYACQTCGACWAGDRDNAELMEEPHSGPVLEYTGEVD